MLQRTRRRVLLQSSRYRQPYDLFKRRQTSSDTSSHPNIATQLQQLSKTDPDAVTLWAKQLSESQRLQLQKLLPSQATAKPYAIPEPPYSDLRLVALNASIPFIGFGFLDNAILILAGDAIDTSLGVLLGISTLCAAAIGNIVSDVAGLLLGTAIEDYCATRLNLPTAQLTQAQRSLRSVRFAHQWGCGVGVVIGCIIGMVPLLFLDTHKVQNRKRQAHLDALFRDVVTEAGSLVGAQHTSLYVRVQQVDGTSKATTVVPVASGDFLYNKYDGGSSSTTGSTTATSTSTTASSSATASSSTSTPPPSQEQWIPLGRGIVSRAALTREAWNITRVADEPDCTPEEAASAHTMLCVPIMDHTGHCIAVLQATNKQSDTGTTATATSFVEQDVQILKALASHISVALLRLYDEEDDSTQLKHTIQLLKEYGLSGLTETNGDDSSIVWRPLFPE